MRNWIIRESKSGRIAGYLQQDEGQVRCSVSLKDREEARLVLLLRDEALEERPICTNGNEQRWQLNREILHAYVLCGQTLLGDTGSKPPPSLLFSWARESEPPENKGAVREANVASAETAREKTQPLLSTCPQMRWPRPPCMPGAKYVDGVWVQEH